MRRDTFSSRVRPDKESLLIKPWHLSSLLYGMDHGREKRTVNSFGVQDRSNVLLGNDNDMDLGRDRSVIGKTQ